MNANQSQTKVHLCRWFNSNSSNLSISLAEGLKLDKLSPDFFSFISCIEIDPDTLTSTGRNISLRASFEDLLALKHALQLMSQGQCDRTRSFAITSSIFASRVEDQKSLTVEERSVEDSEEPETGGEFIALVFRGGTHFEIEHVMDFPRALALADVLSLVASAGIKMDQSARAVDRGQENEKGPQRTGFRSGAFYHPKRKAAGEVNPAGIFGA